MALKDEVMARLIGTRQVFFKIFNIRLKNNSGVLEIRNDGDTAYANLNAHTVKVQGSNASNGVSLTAPGALGGNVALTLPNSVGSSNQVLQTDGAGVLSWASVTSNANLLQVESFTEATSSPLTIFTPAAGAVIISIVIDVSAAAAGGSPTVQVGTAVSPNAYMDTDESDLKVVAEYIVYPYATVIGSPDAVVLTITPSAQTFTGKVFVEYSTPS